MYQCLMAVLVEIKSIPYFWLVRAYNNIIVLSGKKSVAINLIFSACAFVARFCVKVCVVFGKRHKM